MGDLEGELDGVIDAFTVGLELAAVNIKEAPGAANNVLSTPVSEVLMDSFVSG